MFVDGVPAGSTMYIIDENGQAFINMLCIMPAFRRKGLALRLCYYNLHHVYLDKDVKNKEFCTSEARLEMIKWWNKKCPDLHSAMGEVYVGGNGLE